jgi:hypothetical protein
MWPFSKKHRFPGVRENRDGTIDFSLTDEEAERADLALQAFKDLLVHREVADKVRNGTIAVALSRYARELVSTHCVGIEESEFKSKWPDIKKALEKAVASVWKSYSLYPLPIFLYHRASLLGLLGIKDESKYLYALFLKKQNEFEMDQVDKTLMEYEETDIEQALIHARTETYPKHF